MAAPDVTNIMLLMSKHATITALNGMDALRVWGFCKYHGAITLP